MAKERISSPAGRRPSPSTGGQGYVRPLEEENRGLRSENLVLKARIRDLEAENRQLQSKIQELTQSGDELASENQQLEEAKRRLETAKRRLAKAIRKLSEENRDLTAEKEKLEKAAQRLKAKITKLEALVAELKKKLEKEQRRAKRQAAPFSKGDPTAEPKKPGRKKGGTRENRKRPIGEPDEIHRAELQAICDCGGKVTEDACAEQFQVELPEIAFKIIKFLVGIGHCDACGQRYQGRHPEQSSNALGAACSQLGPRLQALVAYLNKEMGLSYGKIRILLSEFGVEVTEGGLVQALERMADRLGPIYRQLIEDIRDDGTVYGDETGARWNGHGAWNWAFTANTTTVYFQSQSRGSDVVIAILGEDWDGTIGHDGWVAYDVLVEAVHQQCLRHILNRCDRMLEVLKGRTRDYSRDVQKLLADAIRLGKRYRKGEVGRHGLKVATGHLESRLDELLERGLTNADNLRLQRYLKKRQGELFPFLYYPEFEIEPVNWPGEQAIRYGVIFRRFSGGHRSARGVRTQDILKTFFCTAKQRGFDPIEHLTSLLKQTEIDPHALDPPARWP